jgi:branched-chain amino acid transport system substrate-binding protein
VLAKLATHLGNKKFVVVYRDEAWGRSYSGVLADNIKALGGKVETIRLTPAQPDYSSEVAEMNRLVEAFGADEETAIVLLTFESETINILGHMRKYPSITKVNLYGSSGCVTHPGIFPPKSPPELAELMLAMGVKTALPMTPKSDLGEALLARIKTELGTEPSYEMLFIYDGVRFAMITTLIAGKYDGEAVATMAPYVSSIFYGISGYKMLDDVGDLMYTDYKLVKLTKTPTGEWPYEQIGSYISTTDTFSITG